MTTPSATPESSLLPPAPPPPPPLSAPRRRYAAALAWGCAWVGHGVIGVVAALVGLAAWGLPFPGRWDSLFVMVGISLPTLACATAALVQIALVRWRRA